MGLVRLRGEDALCCAMRTGGEREVRGGDVQMGGGCVLGARGGGGGRRYMEG